MLDASLQLNIGAVQSVCGRASFSFVVLSSGDAHLRIYCSDPSDGRKSGVLITLDEAAYQHLKSLIEKIDNTINELRCGGKMKKMKRISVSSP